MKKKHGVAWWLIVGWWWYLLVAWWLYPIRYFVRRKAKAAPAASGGYDPRKLEQTMLAVLNILRELGGSALQVDVKKRVPAWAASYFDEAVHELYENGKVRMSKDGSRVRLDLV